MNWRSGVGTRIGARANDAKVVRHMAPIIQASGMRNQAKTAPPTAPMASANTI